MEKIINGAIEVMVEIGYHREEILLMVTNQLEFHFGNKHFEKLDKNVFQQICSYLDDASLKNIRLSSKTLNDKLRDNFWIDRALKKPNIPMLFEDKYDTIIKRHGNVLKYYWYIVNYKPRCIYMFQRGARKGTFCTEKTLSDPTIVGSDKYCKMCLMKKTVRFRLGLN